MDSVVHFEMPAKDTSRVSNFYHEAFGWQMTDSGPEMGGYVVAVTTETGKQGPVQPGAINGGFYPHQDGQFPCPSFVIAVNSVEESMEKITASGGKVIGKPVAIPGVGTYVSFTDTEGNRVSILEATPRSKSED